LVLSSRIQFVQPCSKEAGCTPVLAASLTPVVGWRHDHVFLLDAARFADPYRPCGSGLCCRRIPSRRCRGRHGGAKKAWATRPGLILSIRADAGGSRGHSEDEGGQSSSCSRPWQRAAAIRGDVGEVCEGDFYVSSPLPPTLVPGKARSPSSSRRACHPIRPIPPIHPIYPIRTIRRRQYDQAAKFQANPSNRKPPVASTAPTAAKSTLSAQRLGISRASSCEISGQMRLNGCVWPLDSRSTNLNDRRSRNYDLFARRLKFRLHAQETVFNEPTASPAH